MNNGYLQYKFKPNKIVESKFRIANNSNKNITVTNDINPANVKNGIINYDKNLISKDNYDQKNSSLIKILNKKNNIKLKPYQTKKVKFKIKMINKNFKGTLLYGLNSSYKSQKNTFNITNSILFQNKNKISDLDKIKINNFKISDTKFVFNNFNHQSEIVHNYSYKLLIYRNGIKANNLNKEVSLVPNSQSSINFQYPKLDYGNYTFKLILSDNVSKEKKRK